MRSTSCSRAIAFSSDRTQGIGIISKADAIGYGLSGPNLRGSGVEHDLRKAAPYLDYEKYEFDIPVGAHGDCYDRYLVRMEEMRQSVRILVRCSTSCLKVRSMWLMPKDFCQIKKKC
jgi:NADH:ubiquinone oxidoreductase subunit D